jgi:hypothetical protein
MATKIEKQLIIVQHSACSTSNSVKLKVFCTGILKISVVTDKREYRIYRKFIGDRNKISEEI